MCITRVSPVQAFGVALKTMKKGEEATLDISPACAPLLTLYQSHLAFQAYYPLLLG